MRAVGAQLSRPSQFSGEEGNEQALKEQHITVQSVNLNTGEAKNQRVANSFLSKDECISLIGRCGGILHAFNPYNDDKVFKEIDSMKGNFQEWESKIRRLLKTHEIKLFGTSTQLWVYMAHGHKAEVLVEERVPS